MFHNELVKKMFHNMELYPWHRQKFLYMSIELKQTRKIMQPIRITCLTFHKNKETKLVQLVQMNYSKVRLKENTWADYILTMSQAFKRGCKWSNKSYILFFVTYQTYPSSS